MSGNAGQKSNGDPGILGKIGKEFTKEFFKRGVQGGGEEHT